MRWPYWRWFSPNGTREDIGKRLDDLVGATALAGATVDTAQVVPLGLAVFSALGIRLDDGPVEDDARR